MSHAEIPGSTQLRRYLGRHVARLRTEAGLSQLEAGRLVDHSRHWIKLVESGAQNVRFKEVVLRPLLERLGADQRTIELLVSWAKEAQHAGKSANWWHDYHAELPPEFALYIELESYAGHIRQYAQGVVPGLLQTRSYAEEILSVPAGLVSAEERSRQVQARINRQQLLERGTAPQLEVIMDEAVLRRSAGNTEVMARQLDHLVEVSTRDNITIRVIPFGAGVHGAAGIGQFTMLDFPVDPRVGEPLESPSVCVDTPAGAALLQTEDALSRYGLIWEDLQKRALGEGASRKLISTAKE